MGQKRYDLVWASETLANFESQYQKASKQVRETCKISRNDVVRWVSADQVQWREYKKLVKFRHRFESAHQQLELMSRNLGRTT